MDVVNQLITNSEDADLFPLTNDCWILFVGYHDENCRILSLHWLFGTLHASNFPYSLVKNAL